MSEILNASARKEELRKVVESYFHSLQQKDFAAIPYTDDVVLRAPLAPGGSNQAITGKQEVFRQWWQPLEPALDGVGINIVDHFFNDALTGVVTKVEITLAGPGIKLRAADLFIINEQGMITEQENHFDASPLKS